MKIYLASPLFSDAEREFNLLLTREIENLCDVHLPQRDGPVVEVSIAKGMTAAEAGRNAFTSDISAIHACDVVVAVLDGRAIDEGVCVEIGYAKALGKIVVAIKSDVRTVLPWGNNPMIDGCVDVWVRGIHELVGWLHSRMDA